MHSQLYLKWMNNKDTIQMKKDYLETNQTIDNFKKEEIELLWNDSYYGNMFKNDILYFEIERLVKRFSFEEMLSYLKEAHYALKVKIFGYYVKNFDQEIDSLKQIAKQDDLKFLFVIYARELIPRIMLSLNNPLDFYDENILEVVFNYSYMFRLPLKTRFYNWIIESPLVLDLVFKNLAFDELNGNIFLDIVYHSANGSEIYNKYIKEIRAWQRKINEEHEVLNRKISL